MGRFSNLIFKFLINFQLCVSQLIITYLPVSFWIEMEEKRLGRGLDVKGEGTWEEERGKTGWYIKEMKKLLK